MAYSEEQNFMIRRLFNNGYSDAEIATVLRTRFGRKCQAEAVRKIRRKLGLKKVPSYERWTWVVPIDGHCGA